MLTELSDKQKILRTKIFPSNNQRNITKGKRERCYLFKMIKKRKAEITVEELTSSAEYINNTKDAAKVALALKKLFSKPQSTEEMPSLKTLSYHYKDTFSQW